jgi:hypothetical protein
MPDAHLDRGVSDRRIGELAHFHRLAHTFQDKAEMADDPDDKQDFLDGADAAIRHAIDTVCAFGVGATCPNCGEANVDRRGPSAIESWHARNGGAWACRGVLWPTATRLAVQLLDGVLLTPADLLIKINADLAARPLHQRGHYSDPATGARILADLHKHRLAVEAEPDRWTITDYARQLVGTNQRRERAQATAREQGVG